MLLLGSTVLISPLFWFVASEIWFFQRPKHGIKTHSETICILFSIWRTHIKQYNFKTTLIAPQIITLLTVICEVRIFIFYCSISEGGILRILQLPWKSNNRLMRKLARAVSSTNGLYKNEAGSILTCHARAKFIFKKSKWWGWALGSHLQQRTLSGGPEWTVPMDIYRSCWSAWSRTDCPAGLQRKWTQGLGKMMVAGVGLMHKRVPYYWQVEVLEI